MRKPKNVVNEEQRVGARRVAEVLGHREGREGHAEAGSRRLVHLPKHHAGLLDDAAAGVTDLGLLHFEPKIGALAGPLADAGKHRVATVRRRDAGNQLGENDRLAEAGTAEQARLAAADEGREEVDDFDAGLEELGLRGELRDGRRIAVDRPPLIGFHRATLVDGLAEKVEDTPERGLPHWHRHRRPGIDHLFATDQAVGAAQGHAPHLATTEVLLHFTDEVQLHPLVVGINTDRVVDRGNGVLRKLDVKRRTDDLGDAAC